MRAGAPLALALGLLLVAPAPASAAGAPPFTREDVFRLEYAAAPRISPDGTVAIYERRRADVMTDRIRTELWSVALPEGRHRPLLADGGRPAAPRWSPQGDRVAFLDGDEDGTEIRVLYRDTGAVARIARLERAPAHLAWAPDGRSLAFTAAVPAPTEPMVKPPPRPEGAEWAAPVEVVEAVRYRRDGSGFVEPAHRHVFLVPADGGAPRQLTFGDFDHHGPLSWTPDGAAILFTANRDDDWVYDPVSRDVYRIRVADGQLDRLTDHGEARHPVVSPDGRRIALLRRSTRKVPYRTQRLWVMDADGGAPRLLTGDLDRSVADPAWDPDGDGLYFTYGDHGRRVLARTNLAGRRTLLTDELGGTALGRPYVSGTFAVGPGDGAGDRVVFTRGRPDRPSDLALLEPAGGVRDLTALNDALLGHRALGELREVNWVSRVGDLPIQGWVVLPPGHQPGDRHPLILELHGGPHLAYGPHFSAELQLMAARGYAVLYDNYRGSTGYGEAFALALRYKYSSPDDFADHMAGVDRLVARGLADPDRLFVTGGSAGGIATLYAIGLTDRFRAAAAAKPVVNWVSKVLTADSYLVQIPYQFPALPWEDPDHYWARSPLSLVGAVTTPTLLITGEQDQRTPISETEQYYQALKLRRVPSVMVRVPDASHGIAARPSQLIAKVDHVLAWFARHGGPGDDGTDGDPPE